MPSFAVYIPAPTGPADTDPLRLEPRYFQSVSSVSRPLRKTWVHPGKCTSQPLENGGNPLTATNAHGDQGISALDTTQLIKRFHGNNGTRCANGVAKTNTTSVRVNDGIVHAKRFTDSARLCGESLVGFDDIHVGQG